MSPAEAVSTATALVTLIDKLGGWSLGGLLAIMAVTPAVFVYLSARIVVRAVNGLRGQIAVNEKESAQRFQTFKTDYDNNIKFVEAYEKLSNRLEDTLRRSNILTTKLVDRIDTIIRLKNE